MKPVRLAVAAAILAVTASAPVQAQQTPDAPRQYMNAVSANPFGLLIELFNAEYERVVSESASVGLGGSTIKDDEDRYTNADVFFRFYPSGRPLNGWAFGAKVGLTSIPDHGTHFGYGFDVNRSWLLGRNENFYVGVGFGLKRLLGEPKRREPTLEHPLDDSDTFWRYIPTIRLVNVGFAF